VNQTPVTRNRAAELRRTFDLSFASPPPPPQEVEDLLTLRIAGDAYAIRLRDIAGIVTDRKIIPVPAATLDLLGLAGIRGGIFPVFGLASLLGHDRTGDSPRWMILCGTDEPVALAFAEFDGYLRLPRSSIHADEGIRPARHYVDQLAHTDAGVLSVIGIPGIVATLRNRIGKGRLTKEH
jgi:chemotaxis signal transduction protein